MDLNNKTVLFLGSSVTYGSSSNGVSFVECLKDEFNLNVIKEAVSGTTLVDLDNSSYIARLKNINKNSKVDLFICQLSTNDATRNLDITTIKNSIIYIIDYVKNNFNCPIIFYTGTKYNSNKYLEMINMLYTLKNEYTFYILDLWNDLEMLSITKEKYNEYMSDPIHPTLKGYREWWTPKFKEFIKYKI